MDGLESVWMNRCEVAAILIYSCSVAALSNFLKLWQRVRTDLDAGIYRMVITNNMPVMIRAAVESPVVKY